MFLKISLIALGVFSLSGSARAEGLYGCGDPTGESYGLLFQGRGAAQGFLFLPRGETPIEPVRLSCTRADEMGAQECRAELPRDPSPTVHVNGKTDQAEIAVAGVKVALRCAEIE